MRKFFLPPLLLAALVGVAWYLILLRPEPAAKEIIKKIPFIEIVEVKIRSLPSIVETTGMIRPRTQTTLIAEVPGIIQEVAPFDYESNSSASFRTGGFFKKGDLLLKIEEVDLRTAVAEAVANLSRAGFLLVQERELAKQAKIEWGDRDWGKATELVKRIPQIQKAEAEKQAAEAKLKQAEHNLSKAKVRAPFDGRILSTMADVGQRVGGGTASALAQVYALDSADVDLSLSRSEMNLLGFSEKLGLQGEKPIKTEIIDPDGNLAYEGILDRSEGIVDPKTRLNRLVARVDNCFSNPFLRNSSNTAEPLRIGQFVKLRLIGERVSVYEVPNSAFRTQNTLLVVDGNNSLAIRKVETVGRLGDQVWVSKGLVDGEMVCTTPLEIIADGMKVRIAGPNSSPQRKNQ